MNLMAVVLSCVVLFVGTALLAVAIACRPRASTVVYSASLAVSLIALLAVCVDFADPSTTTSTLPLGLPWLGAHFRLDALAAFFLLVVNLGGATASLYALGYGSHEPLPGRVLPFFPAFLAGMNLVVLADDAYTFLLCWELMSLVSWALVMAHHRIGENVRAAYLYLVMASFGTLTLLLAFGLLAGPEGAYGFEAMREGVRTPLIDTLVLTLVLIGAGSKAGLVPLHAWLPLAHPAAPSHVSALMSGVMTKVAIYAFVRVAFDLLGGAQWWQSMVVLIAGGGTAVLGVLYALLQYDLKRLLAYSTVENVGIVYIGLGLALAFQAAGMNAAAALALTAALFHVFNHSLFKSLLFFGAGAVLTSTGTGNMDQLGGLIGRMPYTSAVFLVGCVAISGLPPLNGFVSEWLTFQAVLQSPELPQWGLKFAVPAVGGLLALTAALVAACFVRTFGISFLGRPRSSQAENACEVDRFSLSAMVILAALCFLAGIVPGFIIDALAPVAVSMVGERMPAQAASAWLSIVPIGDARSSYNGLLVFVFIAFSATFAALLVHRFGSRALRRAPAWDCGFPERSAVTQYSAGSFAQPIRRVFGTVVFRVREHVAMPHPGDAQPSRLELTVRDPVWDWLYLPIAGFIEFLTSRLDRFQFLTIRRYLGLVFLTLVTLLLVIAIWL